VTSATRAVPAVEIEHWSKTFGGVHALIDVGLVLWPGEIHGLLGENGSGKSTLVKILAGYHAPEPGATLHVHGRRVELPLRPGEFLHLGMSFVHQDLGLVPSLTVTENLRLPALIADGRTRVSWARERRYTREVFARYGVDVDPAAKVADIRPVERALLAIVRAFEGVRATQKPEQSTVLVLDEPSVFLSRAGVTHLFRLMKQIAGEGASVLFISHYLEEVKAVTDRVSVLRDGRVVGTVDTASVTQADLIELIVGRRLEAFAHESQTFTSKDACVTVHDLSIGSLNGISFSAASGEVLGLTGLVGSGVEDIPYGLFGARSCRRGQVEIKSRVFNLSEMTPIRAMRAGMALLPADRQRDGSAPSLTVLENVLLPVFRRFFKGLRLNRSHMTASAAAVLGEVDVRPNDPRMVYSALSGGNQQKVLLAKWLQTNPQVLLLHEPTQGVDVGARQEIFSLIRKVAANGGSVLCVSSDYEQMAAICDRVLVIGRGRVISELSGSHLTKERIAEQCLTGTESSW
jgi:ribose transport system ATP-binding protein